jgi:hypothetical protein
MNLGSYCRDVLIYAFIGPVIMSLSIYAIVLSRLIRQVNEASEGIQLGLDQVILSPSVDNNHCNVWQP